ncbi:MFS family permease [Actinoplanes campanulatus]|uniref:MFS family permease n=1 Tax=Actinoplanes campanulatus TaxID=113559 RepID=A0A7W5AN52_9ACTN|nr:hypothetical protein [Actinoplanes campanulatus]MBB3099156.1 MFS family permease [Actinoplanes campanulatus]GGN38773.1 hypothetical protein GCM10010109_65970 [Actinoplanes campanulatus]GID40312.1 hypothetical protein Aca09nite_68180 [Actinoplanes campanulatus]
MLTEGYRLAWESRRVLAAVLLPVVAVALLVTAVLDRFAGERPAVAWAMLGVLVAAWIVGLLAGAGAVVRGLGVMGALRRAVAFLPVFAAWLAAVGGAVYLGMLMVAGTGSVPLVLAVLAAGGLVASRLVLVVASRAIGDRDRPVSWREAGTFLLGGVVVPAFAVYLLPDFVAEVVLLPLLLVAQVGLSSGLHMPRHPAVAADSADAALSADQADPAESAAAGSERVAGRKVRVWPGVAMITVAVLVAGGPAVAGRFGGPVRTNDGGPYGPVAVAWPAGRHPVIVTEAGVWFCDDDLCEEFIDVDGGPSAIGGYATVGIAADGTVVKTAVTGGPDSGGPFLHYARCVPEGCRNAWLPVRANAKEKLDPMVRAEAAGASAPDGALWFFVAAPAEGRERGGYRFRLIRCADMECAEPQRHDIGVTDRSPEDGDRNGTRARLTIGADGRPDAAFWTGLNVLRFSCDPVTCANPRETANDDLPLQGIWSTAGDRSVGYFDGRLFQNGELTTVADGSPDGTGALAVAGSSVYVAAALPTRPERGFHLSIGEPARHWRQTVSRCTGGRCDSVPMDRYDGEPQRELVAVAEDGRILLVRPGRIVLREAP